MVKDPQILRKAKELRIVVVGDIMLDRYIHGKVDRMSPEAPVPVISQSTISSSLGGAANVAVNLVAMGANAVLIGVVGNDDAGSEILDTLEHSGLTEAHLQRSDRKTTVKTRVLDQGIQVLRIDSEDTHYLTKTEEESVLADLMIQISRNNLSGVILQDYNKGVLSPMLIQSIIALANHHDVPVFVDPKFDNFWEYRGCTVFKPNKKELESAYSDIDIRKGLPFLLHDAKTRLDCDLLLCTMAADGIASSDIDGFVHFPTIAIDEVDVSGAGDSTMAIFVITYLLGMSVSDMAHYGNIVGRLACLSSGVQAISIGQVLEEEVSQNTLNSETN